MKQISYSRIEKLTNAIDVVVKVLNAEVYEREQLKELHQSLLMVINNYNINPEGEKLYTLTKLREDSTKMYKNLHEFAKYIQVSNADILTIMEILNGIIEEL